MLGFPRYEDDMHQYLSGELLDVEDIYTVHFSMIAPLSNFPPPRSPVQGDVLLDKTLTTAGSATRGNA
jgi:hypothetical protein